MGRMGELMTQHDKLIWAAGFIDGEGCISLIGDRGTYTAVINVGQTKELPLLVLQEVFGGSVGPVRDRFNQHYQWRVYGIAAANAAKLLLPYLILKAEQARILIAYQVTKGVQGQAISFEISAIRQDLFERMKALNKRRTLDAERLSEEAPQEIEDGAIVRSHTNGKYESATEMIAPYNFVL